MMVAVFMRGCFLGIYIDWLGKTICNSAIILRYKRKFDMDSTTKHDNTSPYFSKFESFREELDIHHDRRERIIKASRDVTAASKKMYEFLAERVN